MKKTILFAAVAVMMGAAAAHAQDAEDLRIYINPGHGSWCSNDRPMKTLREVDGKLTVVNPDTRSSDEVHSPDTTAFYETNTNLQKCLALLDRLESYGFYIDRESNIDNDDIYSVGCARDLSNNLVMSRVKNGPYPNDPAHAVSFNRNLSEICAEVEDNNFDMFISVHSNAATADASTTNYLAFFYRGTNGVGGDRAAGSRDMILAAWPYVFGVEHHPWTARRTAEEGCLGDVSFYHGESTNPLGYAGYLGVLKHGAPGYLVEGYFHTYQPSRARAMNWDADRIEGIQYARGLADYFDLEKESVGEIYGVVRDMNKRFAHTLYTPQGATADVYLPLNGVEVQLLKGDEVIDTYVTDNHYNGGFVFMNLEPGEYTLRLSHPDYLPADENQPTTVTVEAATTSYPAIFLVNKEYAPVADVPVDYPDPLAKEPSVVASSEYVFDSTYADKAIEPLAGATVRRTIMRGDNAIVLALDAESKPVVAVVNTTDGELVRTIGTEGTSGATMPLSDIALTADGVLVGCNAGDLAFGGANEVKVYRWENDEDGLPTGNPVTMIEMNHAGNWNNSSFGQTMAYSGTLAEGFAVISNKSAANANVRFEIISVVDSAMTAYSHMNFNANGSGYNNDTMGDWRVNISPMSSDNIVITSSLLPAAEFKINFQTAGVPDLVGTLAEGVAPTSTLGANFFKISGTSVMVVPVVDADGNTVGVKMLDVTAGLPEAKEITTVGTTLAAGVGSVATGGSVTISHDSQGNFSGSAVNLVAMRPENKFSRFSTQGVEQPKFRGEYAYDLKAVKDENSDTYEISFMSTGDAPLATLVASADGESEQRVELGAVTKGLNKFTFAASDELEHVGNTSFAWSVEVQSKPVPQAARYFGAGARKAGIRGGVHVVTDPASEAFGKIVVANGYAQGIELWSPALELEGTYHQNASTMNSGNPASVWRCDERDGIIYIVDWSDAGSGYWMFDPANPSTPLVDFLGGTNDGTGAHIVDGACIGGGATGLAFQGKGENCRMYSYVEDYPSGNAAAKNGGNTLQRYDIGAATTWAKAPDQSFSQLGANGLMSQTNTEVRAIDEGVFVSQSRAVGLSTNATPAFVYMQNDGTVAFNAGIELPDELPSCGGGLAISPDNSLLAVALYGSGIALFDVKWEENVPSMRLRYVIPTSTYQNGELNEMDFDPAGNLHVYGRNIGYEVYTVVNPAPVAVTPAATTLEVTGSSTGLESVAVEAGTTVKLVPNPATVDVKVKASADIQTLEVYSLSGARVAAAADVCGNEATLNVEGLAPGTYVVIVNSTAAKLIKK